MPFNAEQSRAINAPVDEDILISAGAGSGKTKTLTERVFRLIDEGKVKPSSLLVLTFTKNAAHEMKTRIISRFGASSPKSAEMLSSHVQTFDSFNLYLVSSYSSRLGLSENVMIADDNILAAKEMKTLEELLLEKYEDEEERKRIVSFCSKFALQGDEVLKESIWRIYSLIETFTEEKKQDFLANYDERYLSKAAIARYYHEVLSSYRNEIIKIMAKAIFVDKHFSSYSSPNLSPEDMNSFFASKAEWSRPLDASPFPSNPYAGPLYEALYGLIKKEGDEAFAKASSSFLSDNEAYFVPKTKGLEKDKKEALEAPWKVLKGTKDIFNKLKVLGSEDEEAERLLFFKDDIHLLLELEEEVRKRMDDYKRSTSSFRFADISALSLSLLTEEKYADVAEEVRERFSYIMVDEYQDTNDFQELFLDSLLAKNRFGKRAHLFVVGDAKQSIYSFRNSNVALFRKRQQDYLSGEGHEVIAMNKNYRSGEKLLDSINYLFSFYMRLDHGSIDYTDPSEPLQYDKAVNIYGKTFPNFGIFRIMPSDSPLEVGLEKGEASLASRDFEAKAILHDIKKKMASKYLVYDKQDGIRPCRFSDFAILMRAKKGFGAYQKLFNENGVPLNNLLKRNLREVNSVILIQSLLRLIEWEKEGGDADVKHLFASVARSYAYQYDDETIFKVISYHDENGKDDLRLFRLDPFYLELHSFVANNENALLNDLFVKMLNHFHVVDKLYLIGDVEDSLSKIESFHQIILQGSNKGESLKDFVAFFATIDKYSLDIDADSIFRQEDAVDMMSIHASKGLERKIVYLPVSLNVLTTGDKSHPPLFVFSKSKGFVFPYYSFDPIAHHEADFSYSTSFLTLLSRPFASDSFANPDIDEHVRLFYVALTRAENSVVIVGEPLFKKESLYDMLACCPHFSYLDENYIERKVHDKVLNETDCVRYKKCLDNEGKLFCPLLESDMDPTVYKAYKELWEEIAKPYFSASSKDAISDILRACYKNLVGRLSLSLDDYDLLSRLYGPTVHSSLPSIGRLTSFADLFKLIHTETKEDEDEDDPSSEGDDTEEEEDEGEEESESPSIALSFGADDSSLSQKELKERIRQFASHIVNGDYEFFHFHKDKKGRKCDTEILDQFVASFLLPIERMYGNVGSIVNERYGDERYEDHLSILDPLELNFESQVKAPSLPSPKVDDTPLSFVPRVHRRASRVEVIDPDGASEESLNRGILLHHYLELVDLHSGDTSFILDPKDKAIIDNVLSLPLMQKAKRSKCYKEYGYYDEDLATTGFIDLLFVDEGEFFIVDYKTSDIDDEAYPLQLRNYARNVMRLFGVKEDKIHLYLLSIMKGIAREIPII